MLNHTHSTAMYVMYRLLLVGFQLMVLPIYILHTKMAADWVSILVYDHTVKSSI